MSPAASALPLPYPPAHAVEPSYSRQRDAFRDGSDTPRDYLERKLQQLARLEPGLSAFVHLDLDAARAAADRSSARYREGVPLSSLDGMPIGVKDIILTRDMPTQMGSPLYKGHRSRRSAACVVALQQAGAVIVGKTATTEFAAGRAGPTCNPFDPTRTPGGSSSGSAAAVGAGILPAALGTQTLGSIVRPASYCGAFGWKPSHGAFSLDGVQPLSPTLDHLGVISQHIEDAWAIATVLASGGSLPERPLPSDGTPVPEPIRPRRLVALRTPGWAETDAASQACFESALERLRAEGVAILDEADDRVAALERQLVEAADVAWRVFAWESRWPLASYRDCGADQVGSRLLELLDTASRMSAREHAALLAWRNGFRRELDVLGAESDGFVALASSGPAPVGLDQTGSRRCQVAWSLAGAPSCSIPVLRSQGLPLGLQLMASPTSGDEGLVAVAGWLNERLRLESVV